VLVSPSINVGFQSPSVDTAENSDKVNPTENGCYEKLKIKN
jgi:hypothetical protein